MNRRETMITKINGMKNELLLKINKNDDSALSFSRDAFNQAIIEMTVGISRVRDGKKRTDFHIGAAPDGKEVSAVQQAIQVMELYRVKFGAKKSDDDEMPAENNAAEEVSTTEIKKRLSKKNAADILFGSKGYKAKDLFSSDVDDLLEIGDSLRRQKILVISIITASAVVATAAGVGLYYLLRDDKPAEIDDGDYDIPEIEPTSGTGTDDPFQPTDGTD